jgi:TolA-binding protein
MVMPAVFSFVFILGASLATVQLANAQSLDTLDGSSFVELSVRATQSTTAQDRRGARSLLAAQIGLLPSNMRAVTTNALFAKLKLDDPKTKNDILAVLGNLPFRWSTNSTDQDIQYIYQSLLKAADETTKNLLDTALANAKGLYKEGIADFNSTNLADLATAEPKLKSMAQNYTKSRYAERASFYLGQLYSKEFLLKNPRDPQLIAASNSAFEAYIVKAERGDFDGRADYLATGYFYRGLNGWLAGDVKDARNWLSKGQQKFGNSSDQVYVYQLFVSSDRATVIDKYLPAQATFAATSTFLSEAPTPTVDRASDLATVLRAISN